MANRRDLCKLRRQMGDHMRAIIIAAAFAAFAPLAAHAQFRLEPDPFVIYSARLDPANLVPNSNPVPRNGALATGAVGYAMTGTLEQAIDGGGIVKFAAEAGTRLHRLQVYNQTRQGFGIGEAWCGQFIAHSMGIRNERTVCLQSRGARGTIFYTPQEEDTTMVSTPTFLSPDYSDQTFSVAVDPPSTETPFPLTIYLRGMNRRRITVEMQIRHDGDNTTIWRGNVPIDGTGAGVLPLWSHELHLQRQEDNRVLATITELEELGPGPLQFEQE